MDVGLLKKFRLVCQVSEKHSDGSHNRTPSGCVCAIPDQLMRLSSSCLAADLQCKHWSSSGSDTAQLFVVFLSLFF